jgi:hypothetical protein
MQYEAYRLQLSATTTMMVESCYMRAARTFCTYTSKQALTHSQAGIS